MRVSVSAAQTTPAERLLPQFARLMRESDPVVVVRLTTAETTFVLVEAARDGVSVEAMLRTLGKEDSPNREHSKNRHGRVLPVEGELATIIERRWQERRLDCPYIFHRKGQRIGDFRKVWDRSCKALGPAGRIVHDLRRSGVRHLIRAGYRRDAGRRALQLAWTGMRVRPRRERERWASAPTRCLTHMPRPRAAFDPPCVAAFVLTGTPAES
jgi:hypothetical protein